MPRRRLPRCLKPAECQALVNAARTAWGTARGPQRKRTALRNLLLVETMLLVGLRVSEATGLQAHELDLERQTAFIGHAKGDRDRVCPVPTRLVQPLKDWLAGRQTGFIFPGPRGRRLSSDAVQRAIKALGIKAGIAGASARRGCHPHRLRHSFAKNLLDAGATIRQVQTCLGHQSVATTEIYTFVDQATLLPVVDRL